MMYPVTYPRHPARFAAALFLSLAGVFLGYWLTASFRRSVVHSAPEAGRGGLELVAVGAMTSPQASRSFSPKWEPEVEPPKVVVPEAPQISSGLTPSVGEIEDWGLFSQPGNAGQAAPDVKMSLGQARSTQTEIAKWSLLPAGIKPPEGRIAEPQVKQTLESVAIPLPPVDEHLGPRLLPEMLNRGKPVPPAHPAATGPPLRP